MESRKPSEREMFGPALKRARLAAKLSFRRMADALETPHTTYQYWEQGRKSGLTRPILQKIVDVLRQHSVSDGIIRQLILSTQDILDSTEDDSPPSLSDAIAVPQVTVRLSAGGGAVVENEENDGKWYFAPAVLRHELRVDASAAKIVVVEGDSMEPELRSGDRVLVDTNRRTPSPPGVFAVWDGLGLVIKRVEHLPNTEPPRFRFTSANPAYSAYERVLDEIMIIGRIVWAARRM